MDNLFLYSHEVELLRSVKKSNKKLAKTFNLTSRYTDDHVSSNNFKVCSIFDKTDALDFHIVNFPDLSGIIPTALAYGTYISQLIRYSGFTIIMKPFLLDIPCLQVNFSNRVFLKKTDENIPQIIVIL